MLDEKDRFGLNKAKLKVLTKVKAEDRKKNDPAQFTKLKKTTKNV